MIDVVFLVLLLLLAKVFHMADAQAQALADLTAAVDALTAEVTTTLAAIAAGQQNDSAAIEAQVSRIKDATTSLTAAVAPK